MQPVLVHISHDHLCHDLHQTHMPQHPQRGVCPVKKLLCGTVLTESENQEQVIRVVSCSQYSTTTTMSTCRSRCTNRLAARTATARARTKCSPPRCSPSRQEACATAPFSETTHPPKVSHPKKTMSLAFSPSTERKECRHHSNDGSGLHEERGPQELAVNERQHSEHNVVNL